MSIGTAEHRKYFFLLLSPFKDGLFELGNGDLISLRVLSHQLKYVICEKVAKISSEIFILLAVLKFREWKLTDVLDLVKTKKTISIWVNDVEKQVNFVLEITWTN